MAMALGDWLRRLWRDDGGETVEAHTEPAADGAQPHDAHRSEVARVSAQLDDMEAQIAVLAAQARLVRAAHGGQASGH